MFKHKNQWNIYTNTFIRDFLCVRNLKYFLSLLLMYKILPVFAFLDTKKQKTEKKYIKFLKDS